MPAAAKLSLPSAEAGAPPVARRVARQASLQELERPAETPSVAEKQTPSVEEIPAAKETKSPAPEKTSQSRRRRLMSRGLFALLPFALIAGACWYVTGGQLMSTDDAYVQADTVGISTDVSGIVQGVEVANNQHVDWSGPLGPDGLDQQELTIGPGFRRMEAHGQAPYAPH